MKIERTIFLENQPNNKVNISIKE